MLKYLNFADAAGAAPLRLVPPFYPEIIWHPEHGGLNSRLTNDYIKRQVAPAVRKKQQLAKKLHDAGASLYLGTDVAQPFVLPGLSLQEEMKLFVEAGIEVEQVWELATRRAAERLGLNGLGRIDAGSPADLLVFRKDPTQSLSNLESLLGVVCAGRLYRKEELDRTLAEFSAFFHSPIVRPLAARNARQAMAKTLRRAA
jgi:hypothetical protein